MSTSGFTQQTTERSRQGARAPGKLILSGEHAAVYGAPALVTAIARYTEVWFTPIHKSRTLQTAFENLSKGAIYPLDAIANLKEKLDERFDAFAQGKIPVQNILQRPDDLAIYTLAQVFQSLPMMGRSSTHRLPVPGRLNSRSDLPLGAGMGSSAAVIAATSTLFAHFADAEEDAQKRFEWVRFCERLQHGKGSAVDAAATIYGGTNRVQGGEVTPLKSTLGSGWYWVLTGVPEASTGECVSKVRREFGLDTALWQAFESCTSAFETALTSGADLRDVIRENHALLSKIGVVTEPAARFIEAVEALGGAAKISGAGSVKGSAAGVVLVHLNDEDAMRALMAKHPAWQWDPLSVADRGAHLFEREGA